MRIFVFEFVTGGGWLADRPDPPTAGLLREGNAMWRALVADLVAAGYDVVSTCDARLTSVEMTGCAVTPISDRNELLPQFRRLALSADWSIIIAPETEGWLERYVGLTIDVGARVLASPLNTIRLAADKHATAEHLRAADVPAPRGIALEPGTDLPRDFPFPAVLKPRDGAGSEGIHWIESPNDDVLAGVDSRLEEFCPGMPASVSFLCGPGGVNPLPPCRQILSNTVTAGNNTLASVHQGEGVLFGALGAGRNGRSHTFTYLGGECPLEPELAIRAQALAARAIGTLDRPLGYLGVDLTLGSAADGSGDRVIEINPRLTTSYVGLRALSEVNLADAMIRIADGGHVDIAFDRGPLNFFADGRVRFLARPAKNVAKG